MFKNAFDLYLAMFLPFIIQVSLAFFLLTKKKKKFRFKPYISIPFSFLIIFGGTYFLTVGLVALNSWSEIVNILMYTAIMVLVFAGFYILYKIPIMQLLLMCAMAHTFEHMTYQASKLVLDTGLSEVLWNHFGTDVMVPYTIISYTVKVLVFVGLYFLIVRPCLKIKKYDISPAITIGIVLVAYLIVVVVNVLVSQRMYPDKLLVAGVSFAFLIICLFIDWLVIKTLKGLEDKMNYLLIESALKGKFQQFEIMEKNIQFINMKCHDLRKQLRLMRSKKNELTEEDFSLLIDSLNFYDTDVKTGSEIIDSFIQDRILYCKSLNINFTSLIDGNAFGEMEASDVYFLLLNIVDNAIEAAAKVENEDQRTISLTASRKKGVLVLEETNYFVGKVEPRSDGSIKSSREGIDFHGYGTKSIAYIVKKYEGQMRYDINNNVFTLQIVI